MRSTLAGKPLSITFTIALVVLIGVTLVGAGCAPKKPELKEEVTKYLALVDEFGGLTQQLADKKLDPEGFAIESGKIMGELRVTTKKIEDMSAQLSREEREKADAVLEGTRLTTEGIELITEGKIRKKPARALEGQQKIHDGIEKIIETGVVAEEKE